MMLQQIMRAHDHPGRAEAALQAVLLPKSFLNGVQFVALGQTLHGCDLKTVGLHRKHGAGFHGAAVQQDSAGPAERSLAAHVSAGEPGNFTQKMNQEQPRLN
jgi:hypothetical protein